MVPELMAIWMEALKDMDPELIDGAVSTSIVSDKFCPKVARIIELAEDLRPLRTTEYISRLPAPEMDDEDRKEALEDIQRARRLIAQGGLRVKQDWDKGDSGE